MTEEAPHGPTGAGAVIADVGGDRGALVLYVPKAMAGAEIEISVRGGDVKTHVAVPERHLADRTLFAAFYHSLEAGVHTVWNLDGSPARSVAMTSGAVTEADVVIDADGGLLLTAQPTSESRAVIHGSQSSDAAASARERHSRRHAVHATRGGLTDA